MNQPIPDQDHLAEALQLALLPLADQKEIIALHRSVADNAKVPKADRQLARERADALEKHLRKLNKKTQKNR